MLALPDARLAVGVKVAAKTFVSLLLTARPLNVPPVVVMSLAAKPVGASLKVKVIVAVSPALRALALLVMASVGRVSSMVPVAEKVDPRV